MTKPLEPEHKIGDPTPSKQKQGVSVPECFAIVNKSGLLIDFSPDLQKTLLLPNTQIEPGIPISAIIDGLLSANGKHLSQEQLAVWQKKLKDYEKGKITDLSLTALGKLRITSKRHALHDGSILFTFKPHPFLPASQDEAIKISEKVLSALDDISVGFILYDEQGKFVFCNACHRELYPEVAHMLQPGMDRQEILDAYWDKVGDKAPEIDKGAKWNRDGLSPRGDKERQLPNGRWIQISELESKAGGIVAVRTEITDLKAHQSVLFKVNKRLLEQAQELEYTSKAARQATEAKSNFLSTMSHEIRTPLNGVIGMAQLLRGSDLDSDQITKLDTIITSGQSLLEIINDILDMSKIETGNVDLEYTTFDLSEMLQATVAPLIAMAEDNGLYLKIEPQTVATQYIRSDSTRLRQILTNLLSNAIKFTISGGIILAVEKLSPNDPRCLELNLPDSNNSSSHQHDTEALSQDFFLITVKDTGTGIAEDRLDSIFQSFTQEDNTITRKFGGTGLGLSIVKSLVEMLGGKISVSSKLNLGSQFRFVLPVTIPSEEEIRLVENQKKPLTDVDCPPLKVLVAEDNMVNATIAKAFLEKFGHVPTIVINGEQAVEALKQGSFDLIFMDIHMPLMDGIEATSRIRAGNTQPDIPIIGLTAEAFKERHAHFIESGMNDVLSKPFTEQQLKGTILKHIEIINQQREAIPPQSFPSLAPQPTARTEEVVLEQEFTEEVLPNMTSTPDETGLPIGSDDEYDLMKSQIGDDVIAELIGMAPDTIHTQIDKIKEGLSASNSELIYLAAHTIKGSASSMFAPRLAENARTLEKHSKDISAAENYLPTLQQTAEETIAWWNNKLDS
ncbi:ATP-binding protein [Kiloniella sp. EL199]|uniref:ATP-binding protein n=1 Tax=Kiloniella sp. EL199 TaxID=2107581 RepID=UPI000EA219A1|nr:ATP-binding protein [Kiloniella sp. EL199]